MWYLASGGKTFGPLSVDQLRAMVLAGKVPLTTHAWREGLPGWAPLGEISQLAGLVSAPAPAQTPTPAPASTQTQTPPGSDPHRAAAASLSQPGPLPRSGPSPRPAFAAHEHDVRPPGWLPASIVSLASPIPVVRDAIVRGAHDADTNPWAGAMFVAAVVAFEPHVRPLAWIAGGTFFLAAMLWLRRSEGGMRLCAAAAVLLCVSAILAVSAPAARPSARELARWVGVVDSSFGSDHGLLPLVGWLPDGSVIPVQSGSGAIPEDWQAWASPYRATPARAGSMGVVGIECGEKRRHHLALEEAGGDDPSAEPFLAIAGDWKVGRFKLSSVGGARDEVVATIVRQRQLVGRDGETALEWTWSTWQADGIADGRDVWYVSGRGRERDGGFGQLYFGFAIRDPGQTLHLAWDQFRSSVPDSDAGEIKAPIGHFVEDGNLHVVLRATSGNLVRYDVIEPDTREVVSVAGNNCR